MDISDETREETESRLRTVIAQADFQVLPGVWFWDEHTAEIRPDTIALVKDQDSQSQLVPVGENDTPVEPAGLFSFHFPDKMDNSGFVGWLATRIKEETGSGVFVVCGSNQQTGGIYDYWGCPIDAIDDVLSVVSDLRSANERQ